MFSARKTSIQPFQRHPISIDKKPRPLHSTLEESENGSFTLKMHHVFRPHYAGGIRKRRFHSENTSNVFRPHYAEGIRKQRFHSENTSNVFRPHHAKGIRKQRSHSENTSNVFRLHYAGEI